MPTTPANRPRPRPARPPLESDYAPLYAVAGLTDVLAEHPAGAPRRTAGAGRQAHRRAAGPTPSEQAGQGDRRRAPDQFVITLPEQVRRPCRRRPGPGSRTCSSRPTSSRRGQRHLRELAGRGKRVVDETLGSPGSLPARAEKRGRRTCRRCRRPVDPAFEKVQEGVTRPARPSPVGPPPRRVTPAHAAEGHRHPKACDGEGAAEDATKAPAKKTPPRSADCQDGRQEGRGQAGRPKKTTVDAS